MAPRSVMDEAVFRKCAWRLLPLITAGFLVNFLDAQEMPNTSAQASNLHAVPGNPLLQTAVGRQKSIFGATGMSDTVVLSI